MIKFTLNAPLQSWGIQEVRDDFFPTSKIPTKSGVVGLIACALGLKKGDPRIGELFDELTIYTKVISRGTIMTDYHIIEANKNRRIYLADGKNSGDSATQGIVTYRSYIQNGKFDIVVDGDNDVLADITEAFKHPYWNLYLGRKSCPVSEPIIARPYSDTMEGLIRL